jgi:hypothetical protein
MSLNTQIRKEFIKKIEEALALSTSNSPVIFSLYDIWEYKNDKYSKTHQEHYRYFENLFYNELKIIGGAFSVLEKFSNIPLLLFRKDRNHSIDVKESDFFWFPYEMKYFSKQAATLIDTTFLSTRESQRLDESGPDFLRHINAILNSKVYQFNNLTNGIIMHNALPVIYCDSAEIITLCFCYIIILEKYQSANSDSAHIFSENHIESLSFDSKEGKEVLDFILKKNSETFFDQFLNRIGKLPDKFFSRLGISNTSSYEEIKIRLENFIKNDFKITAFSNYDDSIGLMHKHARFPIIPYLLIYWYKGDRKFVTKTIFPCHLVFPVWNSYTFQPNIKLDKEIVSESKVIFALLTVDDNFYFKDDDKVNNNFSILSRIIHKLGYITSDTVFYNKFAKKSIQNQAIRAAISQVMARNTSHNIGSHVLNKLTGDLSSINIQKYKNYISNFPSKVFTNTDKDRLDQISKFNNYVKCRMDYLSDITFGIPAMQISKRLNSEILSDLDDVRLLLENISGLSNFEYSIKINSEIKNGEVTENNPAIAIPNDILGSQAFYNILENIIRNTAKHSDKKTDNTVDNKQPFIEFTIKVSELDSPTYPEFSSQFYQIDIYDNVVIDGMKSFDEDTSEKKYIEDTKDVAISKLSNLKYLVYSQNNKLNDSILKNDNTLRSTSLGLIEMEASACYLRKMDISNLESDEYQIDYNEEIKNSKGNLNILKAVAIEDKHLGYRFFVLKPTEVLLIGNYKISTPLKNNGFLCLTFEAFKNEIEKGTVFNHQFLVYEDEIQFKITDLDFSKIKCSKGASSFDFYKSLIPKRYFQYESKYFDNEKSNAKEILECLWKKWGELNIEWSQKKISNSLCGENPKDDLVFLNHTYEGIKNNNAELINFNENFLNNTTCDFYIETLSSKAQSKLPKPVNELKNGSFHDRNSVKESAYQQVVIIDERVQYAAHHNRDEGILFHKYYQHSNILVPDMEIDLATNDLDTIKTKLFKYLSDNIGDNRIGKKRFLLIHYSILERLFKNDNDKIIKVTQWLKDYSKKTNVVVISGRGIPPDLPDAVSYVSLSSVLSSLIDFRSKYYFSNIIMSSRKSKKDEKNNNFN